jgi:major membrane immunogen (membrane-anchored lipoprotein)
MKFVPLFVFALLIAGCGGKETSTVTLPDGKGGSTKISANDEDGRSEATITGADGKSVTMTSDVNDAKLPAFAPQYPGSEITSATNIATSGEGAMQTVTMTSSDSTEKVMEFYKASVTSAGMPIGMSMTIDGTGSMQAGKGEKLPSVLVSAAPKDGKTEVTLILTSPK